MIRKQDILDRAAEWQLSADVVEKDYVLGWLLSSLSRHPEVKANWLFKGGTCLKKCFFETYRFSEDLDFSLRPTARYGKEELLAVLREVVADAHQNSGIELPADGIELKDRHNKQQQATYQGKIAYRGPLGRPQVSKILLDLTAHELVVDDADARPIYHAYPDDLPEDPAITYSIEELFAEKTRALLERTRPRDLYDVVQIVENHSESIAFDLAREIFQKKCGHKGISCPDSAALHKVVVGSDELPADWEGMLAHQLPVLPPLASVLPRLGDVLSWLDASVQPSAPAQPISAGVHAALPRLQTGAAGSVLAPPSVTYWGGGPLEQIRFAGANRLLVSFIYKGKARVVEPYGLRRASAGHVLLFAWEVGATNIKQFRVDEMSAFRVLGETFTPRYAIDLTGTMIPSSRSTSGARRSRPFQFKSGTQYVFRCSVCGREFKHERNTAALRLHKDTHGYDCSGRRGYLERIE